MTCCAGVRLLVTSAPIARSRTRAINSLATLKVDVGLQEREAHLAERSVYILLGKLAVRSELIENRIQFCL